MRKCTRVHVWTALFAVSLLLFLLSLFGTLGIFWKGGCRSDADADLRQLPAGRSSLPQSLALDREARLRAGEAVAASKRFAGSFPCDAKDTDLFTAKLCEVESSVMFYSPATTPHVVAKDISLVRYYAQRDLQGWTLAYRNMSFEVVEQSFRTSVKLSELAVFICLGIHTQEKHCIKPATYKTLTQGQRLSQIYGMRDILWRKDSFCFTMREALSSFKGRKNFTFPCWVLPRDGDALRAEMERKKSVDWIVKPSAKGEGHGIFVVNSFEELGTTPTDGFVVQPLLSDPCLVHGKKFDFRTYVLVTSVLPLRAYIYKEGLVRFASSKYDHNATRGGKETQFLTNTSVGKKYTQLSNLTWTFRKLREHFLKLGVDADLVFESINDAIVRVLLSSEYRFLRDYRLSLGGYDCHNCFQLLGVDVILDSQLHPTVIEVNGLPSMQLSHDLGVPPNPNSPYTATKFGLMHDMLQILFQPTSVAVELTRDLKELGVGIKPGPLCDPARHVFCVDYKELQKLLDSKREFVNRGGYQRIYPTASGEKYSELIRHMHNLIRKRFNPSPARTLWHTHHLYTALEKLYAVR